MYVYCIHSINCINMYNGAIFSYKFWMDEWIVRFRKQMPSHSLLWCLWCIWTEIVSHLFQYSFPLSFQLRHRPYRLSISFRPNEQKIEKKIINKKWAKQNGMICTRVHAFMRELIFKRSPVFVEYVKMIFHVDEPSAIWHLTAT